MADITASTRCTSKLTAVFGGRHRTQDRLHHCAMAFLDPHTVAHRPQVIDLQYSMSMSIRLMGRGVTPGTDSSAWPP